MIRILLLGSLFSVVVINASPIDPNGPAVNYAAVARRLVHQTNWAAAATISTYEGLEGFPMASVLSTADSKIDSPSSGEIFFFMIDNDLSALDTKKQNSITFLFTDAQAGKCDSIQVDPYSHNCARAMITGKVRKLEKNTEEYERGFEAFTSRHPKLASWISSFTGSSSHKTNELFLCKLDISNILVFFGRGGYQSVTPGEYFAQVDALGA